MFLHLFAPTSKSQPQPAVIQITNSTLPQKHPNRPLNPVTSKWPTQPSDRSGWYVLTDRFLRSNPPTTTDGQMPEKPGNTALLTALCVFPWHQYYRLDVARVERKYVFPLARTKFVSTDLLVHNLCRASILPIFPRSRKHINLILHRTEWANELQFVIRLLPEALAHQVWHTFFSDRRSIIVLHQSLPHSMISSSVTL